MIEFDHVSKVYPDGTAAVEDLSLTAPDRAITVLVGPSGCGKTTSLRMVNRLVEPTSGTVRVNGVDTHGQDLAALRRGIGYVIQHAGLFPHRTVLDNVATVPVLSGTSKREARAHARDLLERVGLTPEMGERYPSQLSGGQQQRVGVARALAADPPVLLMDEPFSAVDPVVRHGLQDELLRLQEDLGKTIVFVTHDIDEAIRIGDHVAVLAEGGRLAQWATPEELLAEPADDFVAGFVGKDRGFRGLSFTSADAVDVASVTDPVGEMRLEVDEAGRPRGWSGPRTNGTLLPTEGTFTTRDTLRAVADLVLLSPAGAAVRVDGHGRADGLVPHAALAAWVRQRQAQRLGDRAAG